MLPFSIFVRHWVFNKTFLLSSFDAMRRVGSKSTNFAPVDIWLIFALSFFYTKSVHFYFQTKCLCITLCVLTKVMDSALYLYLLRSRRRQYYLIWGAAPVQQHTTALKEKWFWAQELTTAAPHNAAHECVVQQRHARGAGERERGRNEFIFWRCKVLAAGINTVAVKVIITAALALAASSRR